MDEVYLWTEELPPENEVDFASYETPEALAADLRQGVDRWTRVADKVTSDALFMEGMRIGLGFKYTTTDESDFVLRLVHPGSPAGLAGLERGDVILSVNGTPAADVTGDDWGPNEEGLVVSFEVIPRALADDPSATPITVDVTRDWYKIVTVPVHEVLSVGGESVGYFYFDTFVETSVPELDQAFADFKAAGVSKLVVDMRYNGGGLVSTARHLMNLLGSATLSGTTAYKVRYNDNLAAENSSYDFSNVDERIALERVAFITSRSTASASELVINALLPHIDTALVGTETAGKPVGSNSFEFCEKLFFPITFELLNSADEGRYFDGMPADCGGDDQPAFLLGDPQESVLASALEFLETGSCAADVRPPMIIDPVDPVGVPAPVDDPLFDVHGAR